MIATRISCVGDTKPYTAPKEMRMAAVTRLAPMVLVKLGVKQKRNWRFWPFLGLNNVYNSGYKNAQFGGNQIMSSPSTGPTGCSCTDV